MKFLISLLLLLVGINAWGDTYTIDFNKGTTNGTDINSSLPAQTTTLCSSGSEYISSFSGTNCYYRASGCGVRLAKNGQVGEFTITLSNAIQTAIIEKVVVYASKVSGNTASQLTVTPTGTVTASTTYDNNSLLAYSTSSSSSTNYSLTEININGTLNTLTFKTAAGGYVMLHRIDIVTTGNALSVSSASYATFYDSKHAYVMPNDCKGYIWGKAENKLIETYAAGSVVPAGEPLVIYSETASNKAFVFTMTSSTKSENNALLGTDTQKAITADDNYYFYGLSLNASNDINSVGFYFMNESGAAFTNGAHRAYLKLAKPAEGSAPIMAFPFNDDATGVSELNVQSSKLKDGKFIENGKIVIVKNGVKYNVAGQVVK